MKRNFWLFGFILFALIAAGVLKGMLVYYDVVPFNADEAIVALMGRHILQGARPIFFYGQAYMGSLDAFLVALGFGVFGEQVWVIRLVQTLLYLGVLLTTAWLGKEGFGSWKKGVVAVGLLAIPTVNLTLYTTVSLGGYGEALLLGNLTLLCGLFIIRSMQERDELGPRWLWIAFGFLGGLGLWAFGMTLVFSLPMSIYLLWRLLVWGRKPEYVDEIKDEEAESKGGAIQRSIPAWTRYKQGLINLGLVLVGGLIGAAPWWSYAIENGFSRLLWELRGGAIAGVEELPWLWQIGRHLYSFVLLGLTVIFGLRAPWTVDMLAWPLLPFVLIFWMIVIVYMVRSLRFDDQGHDLRVILVGVILTLLAGFIFTPFGADPSGRYFLPLAIPLALFAADLIVHLLDRYGFWAWGVVILVIFYQLWGTVQVAQRYPPGITTQFYGPSQVDPRSMPELIDFLQQHGETRGYSNYWVSYPLAFLSQEELIFVPKLPYHLDFRHTERDNRYLPYEDIVTDADRVAYITTHHPDLDQHLREHFAALDITWEEVQIGDYHVFYALSQVVSPHDINLGMTTP